MNVEDDDDEQLMHPTINGGLNIIDQIEPEILESQDNLNNTTTEPFAANEPEEQAVVTATRYTAYKQLYAHMCLYSSNLFIKSIFQLSFKSIIFRYTNLNITTKIFSIL